MAASLAASSDADAEAAARAVAADGGGCIDAVVAGFFAAAGADPAVLLSPTVALLGGVGVGVRCLDGRAVQPGRGAPRPRGFLPDQRIPEGSYGAAPRTVATLALLHTYGASHSFAQLVRHGTRAAKRAGARRRAALLGAIERHGVGALRTAEVRRSLLKAAGPPAGGLLTEEDLDAALPGDVAGSLLPFGPQLSLAVPPWAAESSPTAGSSPAAEPSRVIAAADGRGLVAAIAFAPDPEGLEMADVELVLSRTAAPVLRGVSRVTPGSPRPTQLTIGLLERKEHGWFAAAGWTGDCGWRDATFTAQSSLQQWLEQTLTDCPAGSTAVAVSTQRGRTAEARAMVPPSSA